MGKKVFDEKEQALKDVYEAKRELERVRTLFGMADPDYFEIANMELTIAQMKYNLTIKKAQKICGDSDLPIGQVFFKFY